jgi:hypothetical protein
VVSVEAIWQCASLQTPLLQLGDHKPTVSYPGPAVSFPLLCAMFHSLQHKQAVAELYSEIQLCLDSIQSHRAADLHAILTLCQHELDLNM